ncbi:hypothetical protein QE152_g37097 [Popillia japonica]|uniref:Uncharacterized protein n=1 Tax=Popillia japonica TaxID=7064 RepID=A0AAW1IAV4_POPJA
MWNIVNDLKGTESKPRRLVNEIYMDNEIITDPGQVARSFNNYFRDCALLLSRSGHTTSTTSSIPMNNKTMFLREMQEYEVLDILSSLKSRKSIPMNNKTMFLREMQEYEVLDILSSLKSRKSSGICGLDIDESLSWAEACTNIASKLNRVKFLGLDIDESLSWAEACTNIASKLNRSCYLFRSLRDLLDFDTLKIVYFSEIESRLRYGILLWGTSGSAGKVLVAQKRIIRTMAKVPYNEPCKPIYKRFKVLTVVNLYILAATSYIHGVKNNFPQNAHGYDTRNASILLPRHTLST